MTDEQSMVEEFHRKFDILIQAQPAIPDRGTTELRVRLIQEEFDELKEALAQENLAAVAKEMADLLYVVYGNRRLLWHRYGAGVSGSASLKCE